MENIKLNDENYFSQDADKAYMSVSQFKAFAGTAGNRSCEAAALDAILNPREEALSVSLLVGSYVDHYFEGTLTMFCDEYRDVLYKKTGDKGLKADYVKAQRIIDRIEAEPVLMNYLTGDKQTIMTGDLFGTPWKIKMDVFVDGTRIVDLKIMKDMNFIWSDVFRSKMDFIRFYGYDIQGAVYQKIVELNTGKKLPFYLVVGTKEDSPDVELIEIEQEYLDEALEFVRQRIPRVLDVKSGKVPAISCGRCPFCKSVKRITAPVSMDSMIPSWLKKDHEEEDFIMDGGEI